MSQHDKADRFSPFKAPCPPLTLGTPHYRGFPSALYFFVVSSSDLSTSRRCLKLIFEILVMNSDYHI